MNGPFDFMLPDARSTAAGDIDALFNFISVVSTIFLVGITITAIYFAIKYRRRSENDTTPHITHDSRLEITWGVIPLILVFIVFSWSWRSYVELINPPDDAYEIRAVGRMWSWEFHYPNGHISTGELHVPVGRPVKMVMISDDVIHSLFIPEFRVKMDVLPNRYTQLWFEATETFESVVYCAEYCGFDHSGMLANLYVHTQEDFEAWLEEGDTIDESLSPAELGEQLVQRQGCMACHSTDGSVLQGPSFLGSFGTERALDDGSSVTVDENYIRESIMEPQTKIAAGFPPIMPAYPNLSDREIEGIIEYIKTLE